MTHRLFSELKIGDKFKTTMYEQFCWVKVSDLEAQMNEAPFRIKMPLLHAEIIPEDLF